MYHNIILHDGWNTQHAVLAELPLTIMYNTTDYAMHFWRVGAAQPVMSEDCIGHMK